MEPPVVTKDPLDSPGLADDVSLKAKEAVTARQETRLSEHDSKVLKRAVLKMDLMVIVPVSRPLFHITAVVQYILAAH